MGVGKAGVEKGDPEEWHAMIHLNVLGVLLCLVSAVTYAISLVLQKTDMAHLPQIAAALAPRGEAR